MSKTLNETMNDVSEALQGLGRAFGKTAMSLELLRYELNKIYGPARYRQRRLARWLWIAMKLPANSKRIASSVILFGLLLALLFIAL